MMYTISRPPTDTFSYKLFKSLLTTVDVEYDAFYLWSSPPEIMEKFFNNTNFSKKSNVVIGIKDLLDMWKDYNYWQQDQQAGTQLIDKVAQRHPETNFVLLTSLENLNKENIKSTNIQIVPWGGDYVNQHNEYQNLNPVLDKDFSGTKHVISLNRNLRDHRIVYLCYLLGKQLDKFTNISCLGISTVLPEFEPTNFLDRIFWRFDTSDEHNRIRSILINGYDKFFNNQQLATDEFEIYSQTRKNDNFSNFNNNLRAKYTHSFVEVVTESSFCSPSYMLTEKTMHTFYGANFPIILSGCGAIQHLRNVGFDMFDDIVDHSYDTISNPIDRIVRAIDANEQLLTNSEYVKEHWKKNQHRFKKNVEVANRVTDYYKERAFKIWKDIKWK